MRIEKLSGINYYDEKSLVQVYKTRRVICEVDSNAGKVLKVCEFVPMWLDDIKRLEYEKLDFYPDPSIAPLNVFNTFKGFAVDRQERAEGAELEFVNGEIEFIKDHIKSLCEERDDAAEYFTSWMADMFQNPGRKSGVCVSFFGDPGAGKGRLFTLLEGMLGKDYSVSCGDVNKVFGKFSSFLKDKILVLINEAKGIQPYLGIFNDKITEPTMIVEPKGIDAYMINSFERWLNFTNELEFMTVVAGCRRHVVFRTSSKNIGNTEYFNRLSAAVENPLVQKAFHDFLMARDISGIHWQNDRVITQSITDLKMMTADNTLLYLAYRHNNSSDETLAIGEYVMSVTLYANYSKWAEERLFKPISDISFGIRLSNLDITKQRTTIDNKRRFRYVLDWPTLARTLATKMKVSSLREFEGPADEVEFFDYGPISQKVWVDATQREPEISQKVSVDATQREPELSQKVSVDATQREPEISQKVSVDATQREPESDDGYYVMREIFLRGKKKACKGAGRYMPYSAFKSSVQREHDEMGFHGEIKLTPDNVSYGMGKNISIEHGGGAREYPRGSGLFIDSPVWVVGLDDMEIS